MKNGFIKVGCASPGVTVANPAANAARIIKEVKNASLAGVRLLVLPELCITGYSCGDLFLSDTLIYAAKASLADIIKSTADCDTVFAVGLPVRYKSSLYNCAAVIHRGRLLGVVPKAHIPNYAEFGEARYFSSGAGVDGTLTDFLPDCIPGCSPAFSCNILFRCNNVPDFCFAVEVCEDIWIACPPSVAHCEAGATVILNLSASDEVVGKPDYRHQLVSSASAKQECGYLYASSSPSESTQDLVFSGHCLIYENGTLLAEKKPFTDDTLITTELDVQVTAYNRTRQTTYADGAAVNGGYTEVVFSLTPCETVITRPYEKNPFVPVCADELAKRAELITQIQVYGLKKRLEHTGIGKTVLGLSGGLDSTLALLVCVKTAKLLGRDMKSVIAITMPCFGTTSRTKSNAQLLGELYGVDFREINISASVTQHLRDLGLSEDDRGTAYENAQARERTQILMDIANLEGGIVIGTGDLSELALGWCTYNGDHMSMYGVNASVPKTLVRALVGYEAVTALNGGNGELAKVLFDILETPVSPELLPPVNGVISQKTEELIGPYELHDFFLYYTVRRGFTPSKTYRLAKLAFDGIYNGETIKKWERVFIKRFFSQQFKRSCMPDGPKVGSVTLSPRGDWKMPSDASAQTWLDELDKT